MRYLFTIVLIAVCTQLFAQRSISGVIMSSDQKMPLEGVSIQAYSSATFSDSKGNFKLPNVRPGDKVIITKNNYAAYQVDLDTVKSDEILKIYLEPRSNVLKDVLITGKRDWKADSLLMRRNFFNVFNYKSLGINDAFVTRSPNPPAFQAPNTPPNSANTIATLNVLSIIGMLNKNKPPISRLKKTLLTEEENNYVAQTFNKKKVEDITSLKGDSLTLFMTRYTPDINTIKTMSEYDLIAYIKESYKDFTKPVADKEKKKKE